MTTELTGVTVSPSAGFTQYSLAAKLGLARGAAPCFDFLNPFGIEAWLAL
jgi:hypothetical protein